MKNLDTLDIMVDLETLGNSTNPVLVQLAAICFKIEEGKPLDEINLLINPKSCVKVGLKSSGDTLDFWLKQDDQVIKNVIVKSLLEGKDLKEVLLSFSLWIKEMMKKYNCKKVKIYGNGPAADCVWIRSAYEACNLEKPWFYFDDVCVRTYVDIGVRAFNFNPKKDMKFEGEKHNAIDDVKHQIKYVSAIYKKITENR